MNDRDHIMQLLRECVHEYAEQVGRTLDLQDDTPLIGPQSPVDSLGLVIVITAFEGKLNDTFATALVLADEKAMSMTRSPFRSLDVMASYAFELLQEARGAG